MTIETTHIRINKEILKRLKIQAAVEGRSIVRLLGEIAETYLKNYEVKKDH